MAVFRRSLAQIPWLIVSGLAEEAWSGLKSISRRSPPQLPDDFTFGVATADHQCEAFVPKTPDIQDLWETGNELFRRQDATLFWDLYPEDIERAAALGCKAFRVSIAWSRVQPSVGEFSQEALEHYRQVIAKIRSEGMEPIVTLHHFSWPPHIEAAGGMIASGFPEAFASYASKVAECLAGDVGYWITFNEPNQLVYGYVKLWWEERYRLPPGLRAGATVDEQMRAIHQLIRNLFLAHAAAREAIRAVSPGARVGANPQLLGLPAWIRFVIDWLVTRVTSHQDLVAHGLRLSQRPVPEQGDADVVVATLTATPDRARQVDFSQAYYIARQALIVKSGAGEQLDPVGHAQDRPPRKIAVVKGSTAANDIDDHILQGRLRDVEQTPRVGDYDSAFAMLENGTIDAILADDAILRGRRTRLPDGLTRYRIYTRPSQIYATPPTHEDSFSREPYAVAIAPGNRGLIDVVNMAVGRFTEPEFWREKLREHLGESVPDEPPGWQVDRLVDSGRSLPARIAAERRAGPTEPLELAPEGTALRRIQDRGHLIAAVRYDVPGFGYIAPDDPEQREPRGLEVDLAREVARQIFGDPARIAFRPAVTAERIPLLHSLIGVPFLRPLFARPPLRSVVDSPFVRSLALAADDRLLVPVLKQLTLGATLFTSNWWLLGLRGDLPEFLCPGQCVGAQDFVGVDYYWGVSTSRIFRAGQLVDAANGRFDRAPVWPGGLYRGLRYCARLFPDQEIVVVENGCVTRDDEWDRDRYISAHVREVQRAVADGINVKGYVCWSITSNREWGHRFEPFTDFGLFRIDLDTDPRTRYPTAASSVYEEIIRRRGVETRSVVSSVMGAITRRRRPAARNEASPG